MNPESRKRAIATMLGTDDFIEGSLAHVQASEHLDRLLAAGFHVAEWRNVEGDVKTAKALVHLPILDEMVVAHLREVHWYGGKAELWVDQFNEDVFETTDGEFDQPTAIMDLPEPPKAEGDA